MIEFETGKIMEIGCESSAMTGALYISWTIALLYIAASKLLVQ